MATESAAIYSTSLLAGAAPPPPSASADPSVPSATPAAVEAAAAAAAAITQVTDPDPKSQTPAALADAASVAASAAVTAAASAAHPPPPPPPPQMPLAAAAAAAAFGQYPPGVVFASPPDPTVIEDQPTYVNPKQYSRILKRRESRKKQTGTDVTSYTPRKRSYMHESRHKHAMQRRRGPGGRFLSKGEREEMQRQKETAAAGQ